MSTAIQFSIIVPCYNEEENIPLLLRNFAEVLHNRPDTELVLVDNGSTDGTGRVLDEEIEKNSLAFTRKIRVEPNQGYGRGILAGLAAAQGKILAWIHADLQTDPADVLRAYDRYQDAPEGADRILVKGRRRGRPLTEHLFSFGMQIVSSLALGMCLEDVNGQPKLFPRKLYDAFQDPPEDFSLDLYLLYLARKEGYRQLSVPVYFKRRMHGQAKGGSGSSLASKWKLIMRTFHYIFKLRSHLKKTA